MWTSSLSSLTLSETEQHYRGSSGWNKFIFLHMDLPQCSWWVRVDAAMSSAGVRSSAASCYRDTAWWWALKVTETVTWSWCITDFRRDQKPNQNINALWPCATTPPLYSRTIHPHRHKCSCLHSDGLTESGKDIRLELGKTLVFPVSHRASLIQIAFPVSLTLTINRSFCC